MGWDVITVWECQTVTAKIDQTMERLVQFLET